MIDAGGGIGGGTGKGAGAKSDDAESDEAGTNIPIINIITDDLELRMLDPPDTGSVAFPPMTREALVVRGERAPKL
jgi:hypothetical protein